MADSKITSLTENTSPQGTDLMVIVDDPAGTPVTQKITISNLMTLATGLTQGQAIMTGLGYLKM